MCEEGGIEWQTPLEAGMELRECPGLLGPCFSSFTLGTATSGPLHLLFLFPEGIPQLFSSLSLPFSLLGKPPLTLIFKVISSFRPIALFCSISSHSTVFYFTFRKKLCFLSVSVLCVPKDVNFVKAGLKKHF